MKEFNDIILAFDKAVALHKKTALATVVQVDGSSYRRPGARMLVTEDGDITGAISGGCLEGDALRKARLAMARQQNKLEIYDTTDDDDNQLGVQLGCNGIVYILFEPIDPEQPDNPIQLLKKAARSNNNAVVVTIFNHHKNAPQTGTICCLEENEGLLSNDPDTQADIPAVFRQKTSAVLPWREDVALYQFVPPPIRLIIAGAGNDTQPLVEMAFLLGWHIVVLDGRPVYATPQRFPKAHQVSVVKSADFLSAITINEQTAVALMTHNYNYDLAVLEQLIGANCPYIGLLGPRKKRDKMLGELAAKGVIITPRTLQHIHGPVGLDIGAETSEEIALSVIAEIKAVFSHRRGGPLKDRPSDIHERPAVPQYD